MKVRPVSDIMGAKFDGLGLSLPMDEATKTT